MDFYVNLPPECLGDNTYKLDGNTYYKPEIEFDEDCSATYLVNNFGKYKEHKTLLYYVDDPQVLAEREAEFQTKLLEIQQLNEKLDNNQITLSQYESELSELKAEYGEITEQLDTEEQAEIEEQIDEIDISIPWYLKIWNWFMNLFKR
jgi:hypothetical protein